MTRLSDNAIEIINELHTERLDYTNEYLPLIDAAQRLAHYEDLEEQGRLVELPCKIGTTVYRICKKKYDVDGYGMQWCEGWGIVTHGFSMGNMNELGKTVFLTREEAAKALKVR